MTEEQKTEGPKSDAKATPEPAPKKKQAKKKAAKPAKTQAPIEKVEEPKETAQTVIQPGAPDTAVKVEVCLVTVKQDGFRRAGRAWTGTTVVDLDELTEEQLTQLMDDDMFDVQFGTTDTQE
jgi:hypothetical protein